MKRTVEFVADRVSSNYIKKFRAGHLPKLVHEGVAAVKNIKAEVATNGLDIRTKVSEEIELVAFVLSKLRFKGSFITSCYTHDY